MGNRYGRSNKRQFRVRRQRAGFTLFATVIACIIGGLFVFGVGPYQRTSGTEQVQSAEKPTVAEAPKAIDTEKVASSSESRTQSGEGESSGDSETSSDSAGDASGEDVSEEPEMAAVPDVPYNATEEEARKFLEDRGFELGEIKNEYNSDYDKGGVFYQDPLPDVEAEKGSEVGITLSKGPEPESEVEADPPDPDTLDLYLTVPKMGLVDDYVVNDASEASMLNGAGKITETGFPWQPNANTYIASHVYGYQGTGSWQHFAALPNMTYGDEIILSDSSGTTYTYEVTNIVTVTPTDTWITEPTPGKDMVSLQTCVGPGWSERMVVQAERVSVDLA